MHKYMAVALILVSVAPAGAGERTRNIDPFLDEHTFAVARLDVTRVKPDALFAAFGPFGAADAASAKSLQTNLERWMGDLTRAGGRELFLVLSLADGGKSPFLVVPLKDDADAKGVTAALRLTHLFGEVSGEKIGDAIVAGESRTITRLRTLKPVERPELEAAFIPQGDAAVLVAFIPPPHLVRVFGEHMPVLPKEIGGGSSKVLTRGVSWAALSLDTPPKLGARLTIQSADADAAKALHEAFGKTVKTLTEQRALPNLDKALEPLKPKVEEDRLVLHLDETETRTVLGPLVRQGVRAVGLNEASNRMRRIALATINYADANKGKMPANITDKDSKPLLSWRVAILPFIEQEPLYKEFHLDEPWDSEHNKKLVAQMPKIFAGLDARSNEQGKTVLLAPTGEGTAWPGKPIVYPGHFADGTSLTILLVLADYDRAVEWSKPDDLRIDPKNPHAGLGQRSGLFVFGMADASVHMTKPTVKKQTLWAAFTANGNDEIGIDW